MSKRILIATITCLSILLAGGSLLAEDSNKSKLISTEGSLLVGLLHEGELYGTDFSGLLVGGVFLGNILGLEVSAFHAFGVADYAEQIPRDRSIYSANISLNVPLKERFSLFVTVGAGLGSRGQFGGDLVFNKGGGAKVKLRKRWYIRVEYREWEGLHENDPGASILVGVSYSF